MFFRKLTRLALLTVTTATLLLSQTSNSANRTQGKAPQVSGLPPAADQAMTSVDAQRIRAHVKFLASDLLEGRGTGQRGGDIAAEYIATQFALYGLKPAGDNGTLHAEGADGRHHDAGRFHAQLGAERRRAARPEATATTSSPRIETGNARQRHRAPTSCGSATASTLPSTTGTTTRASTSRARCCSCW